MAVQETETFRVRETVKVPEVERVQGEEPVKIPEVKTVEMRHSSLFDAIRDLRHDIQNLIKEEVKLAKAELTQKFSHIGRNAVWLAIGAVLGFIALLMFTASLGALLAYAFVSAGLSTTFSWFLGLIIVALLLGTAGGVMAMKAIKTFSQESLKPERTVQTIKEISGTHPGAEGPYKGRPETTEPKKSPEEIQSQIDVRRTNMEKTMEELSVRLTPRYMGKQFVQQVKMHPIRASLIGAGTGIASFLAIRRRLHDHNHKH